MGLARILAAAGIAAAKWLGIGSAAYGLFHSGLLHGKFSAARFAESAAGFARTASYRGTVAAGVLYLSAVVLAVAFQRKLIFFPTEEDCPPGASLAAEGMSGVRDVEITTADGETLKAYAWAPLGAPGLLGRPLGDVWLVVMHGNAGTRYMRMGWFHMLRRQLGVGILAVDYRGYGGSTGAPSQAGLYADGEAVVAWLRGGAGGLVPADHRVVLYGESIGSSVCTWMATRARFDGLILHAPFTSVAEAGQMIYPILPVKWLMSERFDTMSFARDVAEGTPKLVLHGRLDNIVPFVLGARLYDRLAEPKKFVPIDGADHNNIPMFKREYLSSLASFLEGVAAAPAQRVSGKGE